jgi:hypothetical protein
MSQKDTSDNRSSEENFDPNAERIKGYSSEKEAYRRLKDSEEKKKADKTTSSE